MIINPEFEINHNSVYLAKFIDGDVEDLIGAYTHWYDAVRAVFKVEQSLKVFNYCYVEEIYLDSSRREENIYLYYLDKNDMIFIGKQLVEGLIIENRRTSLVNRDKTLFVHVSAKNREKADKLVNYIKNKIFELLEESND